MKIHYFQRYHSKENVATANTMLLLSRLYHYSPDKFFSFLKSELFFDSFEPEIIFNLQEKRNDSIPDATITQESFKIVVETKMSDWFYSDQLERHLKAFDDEKYKLLISLAPELMDQEKKRKFEESLKEYNFTQKYPVIHINTTFEKLADSIQELIDDRDYELQDVLDDYYNYCYNDGLIAVSDDWKYLRVRLSGTTYDFNIKENVYYDNADNAFRAHCYLGLYKQKSVRAIGKIDTIITAQIVNEKLAFEVEKGEISEKKKQTILNAIEDSAQHGYDLKSKKHRYFFVEKFYETDFKKATPRAPMGARVFDLTQVLETSELPDIKTIAELLKDRTWN